MARPRVHDLDQLLDAAEHLAVESGPAAVTVRAISELTSVSNGAIYHAFGSRAGLVGQAWLRAAQRFLAMQDERVEAALEAARGAALEHGHAAEVGTDAAIDAVVVAADTPVQFTLDHPASGRFLLTVSRDHLLGSAELPDDLAADLQDLDGRLANLFAMLSRALWGRADRASVEVIRDCVVELPNALLLRGRRAPDRAVRERLAACVRAVLALGAPPPLRDRPVAPGQPTPPDPPPTTIPPAPQKPTEREGHH